MLTLEQDIWKEDPIMDGEERVAAAIYERRLLSMTRMVEG